MFNISFITCIKRYISYKSVEDQTFYGRNGCLTPSHSVTQPPDLGFWLSRSSLVFICFGQNVTRTKIHVFWQFYNQDPKPCKFSKFPIMYLFFSYLLSIKKKSDDSIPLTQKERCPKSTPKISLFFERHSNFGGLSQCLLNENVSIDHAY